MACCKVPIKIAGFSGGCAKVTDGTDLQKLVSIVDTTFKVSTNNLSNLAYLGLKCVNIACPPHLVVADELTDLVSFLDAQLRSTIDTNVNTTALGTSQGHLLIKNGIALLIAGCGCCSS